MIFFNIKNKSYGQWALYFMQNEKKKNPPWCIYDYPLRESQNILNFNNNLFA